MRRKIGKTDPHDWNGHRHYEPEAGGATYHDDSRKYYGRVSASGYAVELYLNLRAEEVVEKA